MIDRTTRLRWRRRLRRRKHQVEDIGVQAEEHIERHFFRRLTRLQGVYRFVAAWTLLVVLLTGIVIIQFRNLDKHFLTLKPVAGGTYTEGILGTFTNANPIYATDSVNASVAQLVFSGLFKYDSNNKLINDLAQSWNVDGNELTYTVNLKNNLRWQDGAPLTAADVVFTVQSIQNPDSKSPLQSSWQGIKVVAASDTKVVFTLPNPLTAFRHSLTTGLLPKHLLQNITPAQLRSAEFNTSNPVGSGPFAWQTLQVVGQNPEDREEQIALEPNKFYANGVPKLGKFIIRAFNNNELLEDSFKKQELTGAAGLESLSTEVQNDIAVQKFNIPLLSEVLIFLKNTHPLLKDPKARSALAFATDRSVLSELLGYSVIVAKSPILKGQVGFDKTLVQSKFDLEKARGIFKSLGWSLNSKGILEKKGQEFQIKLFSQSDSDYSKVANEIKKQWSKVGVDVAVNLLSESELRANHLSTHDYDAILYGIELGPDPDAYVYWASKQADIRALNRLNFSEYSSTTADLSLEAGRTRSGDQLRAIKYKPFLKAWISDNPAIALYQPRFLYLTRGEVFGFSPTTFSSGVDRYANVSNWMIRQKALAQ